MDFISRQKQRGVTLIELVVVIGIAALIVVTAMSFFSSASDSNKIKDEVANIGTLNANINRLYTSATDYSNISIDLLRQAGAVPKNMIKGTTVQNKWGGAVTIAAAGTGNSRYDLTYANVPGEACTQMVAAVYAAFEKVTIKGTVVHDPNNNTIANPATIAPACGITGVADIVLHTR